jgi:mannose-6-phosphate isomerase-like protein (cupin superfamily)
VKARRVATGHDDRSRAVFASDEEVDPVVLRLMPGAEFHLLWGGDEPPTFPDTGSPGSASRTYFPPVGGYRFGLVTIPPAGTQIPADLDLGEALAEVERDLPGMLAHTEPDDPGMHTTDTIDFEVILAGELVLELDDGAETVLRPGDTVVQNGTRHRWHNRGAEPATMAVFMTGAHRKPTSG